MSNIEVNKGDILYYKNCNTEGLFLVHDVDDYSLNVIELDMIADNNFSLEMIMGPSLYLKEELMKYCEIAFDSQLSQDKKCNCDIRVIMTTGCYCGGV